MPTFDQVPVGLGKPSSIDHRLRGDDVLALIRPASNSGLDGESDCLQQILAEQPKLLTRLDLLPPGYSKPLVRIAASSLTTDTLALHDRPDPLDFRAVRLSVERAIYQAGITRGHIDFFELYDAFSIYAVLSLEAAGFARRGEGWGLARDGAIQLSGSIPFATFGGLKARGNPWGATGVYQAVESVLQLRHKAGANQVPAAKFGMIQCLGGPASTVATHILESLD